MRLAHVWQRDEFRFCTLAKGIYAARSTFANGMNSVLRDRRRLLGMWIRLAHGGVAYRLVHRNSWVFRGSHSVLDNAIVLALMVRHLPKP